MSTRLENNKVAARYAKALFETTLEANDVEAVAKDLTSINELFQSVAELSVFLENPAIPVDEKLAFVKSQFAQSVNPRVTRLMNILLENKRVAVFPQLVTQFNEYRNRHENSTHAEVITAIELEQELRTRIQKTLESQLGFNRVELSNRVDPGLLGGAIIKIQDKVIDGSYVGRLEELRKQISKL